MPDLVHLRPVTAGDAQLLFRWVNDADVRAMSFTADAVSWPQHLAWLESKLAPGTDARLWMAETADGAPLGQIRFEIEDRQAVLSVSIDRDFRGRGYGSQVIAAGCCRLFEETRLEQIVAYVKPENIASQKALAQAGFVQIGLTTCRQQPAQAWCRTRRDQA